MTVTARRVCNHAFSCSVNVWPRGRQSLIWIVLPLARARRASALNFFFFFFNNALFIATPKSAYAINGSPNFQQIHSEDYPPGS